MRALLRSASSYLHKKREIELKSIWPASPVRGESAPRLWKIPQWNEEAEEFIHGK